MKKIKRTSTKDKLSEYVDRHRFDAADPLLAELRQETWATFPDHWRQDNTGLKATMIPYIC
jgi:hypothetical protein